MCPTDARTVYPLPRYFSIVFAFAGDSTITNFTPLEIDPVVAGALFFSRAIFLVMEFLSYVSNGVHDGSMRMSAQKPILPQS